ncbi:acyltransferase family protein [Modestobacter italicus]|uniref:acyltransferase family protein n=1 Tax=Modestobacter italicus (strain DSM 44449 / CECT 9708 / BC 501) TaxID=2732864 RepID=UPI001C95FEA4|nr:acyltransferase [Modestobacter italicus]
MTEAPARPQRVHAIDVARAVAIVGVAANHSIDGMLNAGLIPADHPLETVNSALYLFRMPALAFLLGLFVPRAVTKRGGVGYVRERVSLMLYLYLLWYVLQSAAEAATNGLKNTPRDTGSIWSVWITFAHLWFLPFLIVTSVVLAVSRPWVSRSRGLVVGVALLGVSLVTWGWNPDVFGLTGLSLLVFAAAGSVVGLPLLGALMQRSVWGWTAVGAVGLAALVLIDQLDVVPGTVPAPADLAQSALSLCAAVAGTVALLAVSVLLSHVTPLRGLLAAIGRRTLPIYLAHVIVVAGVRVVLLAVGVDEPFVIAAIAIPLGVAVPFVAAVFAEPRPWANWVFDLPRPWKTWSQGARPPAAQRPLAHVSQPRQGEHPLPPAPDSTQA